MKPNDGPLTPKPEKTPKKTVKTPEKAPNPLKKPTKIMPVKPL